MLDGIPPQRRGMPKIEVSFDIDANGIVSVKAKDLNTGKEQKITITASSNLSKEDIERMMNEAQMHAKEDEKAKDLAQKRNDADCPETPHHDYRQTLIFHRCIDMRLRGNARSSGQCTGGATARGPRHEIQFPAKLLQDRTGDNASFFTLQRTNI